MNLLFLKKEYNEKPKIIFLDFLFNCFEPNVPRYFLTIFHKKNKNRGHCSKIEDSRNHRVQRQPRKRTTRKSQKRIHRLGQRSGECKYKP